MVFSFGVLRANGVQGYGLVIVVILLRLLNLLLIEEFYLELFGYFVFAVKS